MFVYFSDSNLYLTVSLPIMLVTGLIQVGLCSLLPINILLRNQSVALQFSPFYPHILGLALINTVFFPLIRCYFVADVAVCTQQYILPPFTLAENGHVYTLC